MSETRPGRPCSAGDRRLGLDPWRVGAGEASGDSSQVVVAARVRELALGAAVANELVHEFELLLAAQPPGMSAAGTQASLELLDRRNAATRAQVDQPRLHAVARGQEAVLLQQLRTRRLGPGL